MNFFLDPYSTSIAAVFFMNNNFHPLFPVNRLGQELISEHHFTADCVQPKCAEVRNVCQRLEARLNDRKRLLHR